MPPVTKVRLFAVILSMMLGITAWRSLTDTPLDNVLTRIDAYRRQFPHEKIYLHTDRDTYLPGETIWLKSYLFYGDNRAADSTSGAILVDLVSPDGRKIRLDTRFPSAGGYGEGYLTLPDSLETGRYTLRAYTGWMRNFPEDWYFSKPVDVVRANEPHLKATPGAMSASTTRLDVQFLPEGGQLVAGLAGRVAFKAINAAGVGVDVTGFVLNDKNDTIVGFQSQHLGMGTFPFQPEAGQNYRAFAQIPGTAELTSVVLPAALPQGYVMQVDNLSSKDNIRVYVLNNVPTAPAASSATAGMLTVLAQVNGQPVHAAQIPAGRQQAMIPIPRAKCPEGIVQLTLLDAAGKPACERLIYSAKQEMLTLTVTPQTPTVGNRKRVDLTVTAADANGKPVVADLSLAVTDAGQQTKPRSYGPSLPTYLLLTSDLTGYVEQPGYYFDPKNANRLADLDLLLLTQGWRRITWKQVLVDSLPPIRYLFDPGLTLSGTVYRGTSRQPAPAVPLTAIIHRKDSTQDIYTLSTDERGRFFLGNANLIDTTSVFIQAAKMNGNRNFSITLDKLFAPQIRVVRPPLIPVDLAYDELADLLKRQSEYAAIEAQIRRNREIQLQAVVVKAKRADPYASQRALYGTPDASLKIDDIISAGAVTVFDMLRSRVAGVQVSGGGPEPTVQIRGAANFSGVIEPLFLLDGIRVDKSTISTVSPRDVAAIDVLKGASTSLYGSEGAGGVIAIITKRGGDGSYVNDFVPGVRVEKVVGYQPGRVFYAPRYDNPTPEEKVRPDYRATLLWAPRLRTDATGKATVSFYTSDAKTALRLVLEGATTAGQPGHAETQLTVQ